MNDFYCNQVLPENIIVKKVIETDNVLAFHHTQPQWPIHIIVIPKKHVLSLLDLIDNNSDEILLEMMSVIKKIIQQVIDEQGECRLTTNFGNCQTSKHLHWHIYIGKMLG